MKVLFSIIAMVGVLLSLSSCAKQSSPQINQNPGLVDPHMPKSATKRDIRIIHFSDRPVSFEVANGLAYFEGDIVLGKIEDLEALAGKGLSTQALGLKSGTVLHAWRWDNRVVPYTISSSFSANAQLFIQNAIKHWEDKTAIHFVPRTTEADYITFILDGGCASYVGKIGGPQNIWLAENCGLGATIHEIGHAMGYWHEQSRCNRDTYVKVLYENIISGFENNFNKNCADGTMIGAYDYSSIMHYPTWGFSKNGLPTIETIPPGIPIGEGSALSARDLNGVVVRYRSTFPCTSTSCKYRTGIINSGLSKVYTAANNSTLEAWTEGAPGTNFNLYLQRFDGTKYVTVASSITATSAEHVLATGLVTGTYRWVIRSASGSPTGSFDLWTLPN